MKHTLWSLDEYAESCASLRRWQTGGSSDPKRRQMLTVLKNAVSRELTGRQLECVRLYYYENKNIPRIAEELHLNPSTVCRHLKKARARLSSILNYYFQEDGLPSS